MSFHRSQESQCRTAVDDVLDYILEVSRLFVDQETSTRVLTSVYQNSEAELAIASDLEVRILNSLHVDHTDLPAEDHTLGHILSYANPFRIEVDKTGGMLECLLCILILLTGIAILVGTLVPLDEEPYDDSDAGVTLAEYRIGKSLGNHEDSLAHVHLGE